MGFVHSDLYYLAYLTVDLSFRPRLSNPHIWIEHPGRFRDTIIYLLFLLAQSICLSGAPAVQCASRRINHANFIWTKTLEFEK